MIKKVNISNFKSLKNVELELGDINVLCGTNASGKSSFIQSVLLVSQNIIPDNEVVLNGELVNLGEFIEIKNFDASMEMPVSISLINNFNDTASLIFNHENIIEKSIKFPLINKELFYLAANRMGNADVFDRASKRNVFGSLGEYAISFLEDYKETPMPQELIHNKREETAHLFIDEVNYWMKKITGSILKVEKLQRTNKLVLSYSNNKNYQVRTSNTGSGLSYVVSIIILGLGVGLLRANLNEKPVVIIENPEIHLHPKAQAELTEFMVWLSQYAQIIIESHSDHIFNGVRKMIKRGETNNEKAKIFFFNLKDNDTIIKKIEISKNGKLLTLEKDLFDQFQIDLAELLRG